MDTIVTPLNVQSGYWHQGSEPEIESKDDLSTNTDDTSEPDPHICKVEISSNVYEYLLGIVFLWIIAAARGFGEG